MHKYLWWQEAIIYHIYPLSFQDSNGDGYGDLQGIIDRLDYLQWLGANALWLSPIYPSPLADFGYDVSDYTDINPLFGTMDDFDRLLAACHKRGIKLVLDFVLNHTSVRHSWFQEARLSRKNPWHDWYLWQEAKPQGGLPNNWLSTFGGSAWEWNEATGEYYYHAYLKEQPDLNWRNPEVKHAMFQNMRFWLDKGVDGFRLDALAHIFKDRQLRDNPPNPDYDAAVMPPFKQLLPVYDGNQPEVHPLIAEMRRMVDRYQERLLIGEMYLPVDELINYYGWEDRPGLHLPYNFQLIQLPWTAAEIYAGINLYEGSLPAFAWPSWVLGNHDKPRVKTRVGKYQARNAALLLLTLRGTPTMYYGDEIGMENGLIPADRVRDPVQKAFPGRSFGRDPERTPMQWQPGRNAGFSTGEPWLPLASDYEQINVETASTEVSSLLDFYRQLIALRQKEPALRRGSYRPVAEGNHILAFLREYEGRRFLIAVNLSHTFQTLFLPYRIKGEIVCNTAPDLRKKPLAQPLELGPDEGILALVSEFG